MDIVEIIKAIILGMVEGLTEFAPVSSTGHMIIVDDMWLKSQEFLGKYAANTFKVVIQLGSILAVVVVFKDRFIDLLGLRGRHRDGQPRLKLMQVIVGLIPAGVLGVLFDDYIDEHLFSTATVLIGLVLGALLMIAADWFAKKNTPKAQTVDQITYKQAIIVGLVQCLSLWPGFSRSGSTISGGVLAGMSHRAAADFTFIMAVPIMAGASGLSLLKNWQYVTAADIPFFIAGFISAFLFALLAIRFFLHLINRVRLVPFAVYRIVLALVIYVLYF
ncbi:undecaprenyl-diphosphate phosphatase [Saccharococcus caldoxylosilyticus]|jgi:undecaprenyl-diphosphatase|uniref:Undecaprenyl-diphosphatase n=1 Tax=Parageobacillus caldoxylosilyticus NBRC 107762 TaxID=1220594 RepID=A0A023DF97_9BACL|nr:undecaprenyl-diphosphate phosphatase [Parageobacillus caldoxylosilyticus]MBB3853099.1 undecaprenyl-diphosphatase [Parageobacillus caldoxylosilyticus]OQP02536.1 undecaprenyl-diphosphatase [Geobacillus sp. 44B]QNU38523.1 undecaprenyl-diphosphate phosphatase [Geobacillus sp. 44B]GAJ39893.1 undecaprenyl-diphosphatase [Parageobacillus caldoxylosilyticus NBRC 107762]